ncbi:hypothetical protein DID73_00935 [Candidatus Marinamargulisbacteria bacterium SCGC AG-343-K17]|nr:hypothetical protein DID73_00935 [Candidatus Marinamargulisbacteria bacterium SCGC AG-343-K17]
MNITLPPPPNWIYNSLKKIQKEPHGKTKCAIVAGILDSTFGLRSFIKKSIIQAGPNQPISKLGKSKFGLGFLISNTSGHVVSSMNLESEKSQFLIPVAASTIPLSVEFFTRNLLTNTPRTSALIVPLLARETSYWAGVSYSYNTETNWTQSLATQLLFSGIIANVFDTAAGITSSKKLTMKELCNLNNNKSFKAIYFESLPIRILTAVLIPWACINAVNYKPPNEV